MDKTVTMEELIKTLRGMAENLPTLLAEPVSIAANRLELFRLEIKLRSESEELWVKNYTKTQNKVKELEKELVEERRECAEGWHRWKVLSESTK